MGLLQTLMEHKEEFYRIFDEVIENSYEIRRIWSGRNYDELILDHLRAWTASRIMGASASMAFYAEDHNVIKLIDKLATHHFKEVR